MRAAPVPSQDSKRLPGARVFFQLVGVLATGAAVARQARSAFVLGLAALVACRASHALDQEWDTISVLFRIATIIALAAAIIVLLPQTGRRAAISLMVLFHFGDILTPALVPHDRPQRCGVVAGSLAGAAASGRCEPAGLEPSVSANLALRLMQVNFCIIYMTAGPSKLLGGTWWSGTAVRWTLANYEFAPLRVPLYYEALRWMAQHRLVWELVMTGGVLYTLVLEISFPYLVWKRELRWLMVLGSVLLHLTIGVFMGLATFGLLMMALVLSFVPAEAVHRLLGRPSRGAEPRRAGFLASLRCRSRAA